MTVLKNQLTFVLAIGILLVVGLACGKSKPAPAAYVGTWTGEDGSTMTIKADGSADYKSSKTSVDGGSADIDEAAKTLKIGFAGIGPSFTIDKAPSGDQMTLSGVVYKKNGGGSSSSTKTTDTKPADASNSSSDTKSTSSGDAPSNSDVEDAIKSTLADFTEAVDTGNFSDFVDNASKDFQASNTAASVKSTFNVFVEKKDQVLPSLNDAQSRTPNFTNGPSLTTEKGIKVVSADGEFPSKPYSLKFETKYEQENGQWKMLAFKIKM